MKRKQLFEMMKKLSKVDAILYEKDDYLDIENDMGEILGMFPEMFIDDFWEKYEATDPSACYDEYGFFPGDKISAAIETSYEEFERLEALFQEARLAYHR